MSYVEPRMAWNLQVGWEEESSYRTRPTNINRYIRCYNPPTAPIPMREIEEVHAPGHGRAPAYINDQQRQEMKGTLPIEIVSGEIIGAIFGKVITTGSSPYTHTYNISNTMPGSFATQYALVKSGDSLVKEFLGCRVDSALFKSSEDGMRLLCDIGYFAAKAQDGGTVEETISTNIDPPFNFKEGVLSSTQLYSGAKARIHGFELPIALNCKPNYVGGYGYQPYEILPGKASFGELALDVGIEDDTEWDEIYDETKVGTAYDFSYLFTRGSNDTISFAGNAKLKHCEEKYEEHDVRARMIFNSYTLTVVVVNSTATFPFA